MATESDWQDLAAQGHAVGAIRAYCAAHGVGLPEAMAAVERWRAVNCPPSPAYQRAFRVARRLTDRLLEYLGQADPRSVQVRILAADPKDVVGQNPRFFSEVAPDRPNLDLAVEVAMEGVSAALGRRVADDHLNGGARMSWVVEYGVRLVRVYAANTPGIELGDGEPLGGGDVLPGFSCDVADLFA